MEQIRDGLSSTVFVTEKRVLASAQPCNNSTGWVSGVPMQYASVVFAWDALFSGKEGAPAGDETDPKVQCTSAAGGPHGSGGNVLFGDGSVRYMTFGLDADFWQALLSVNGREDLDLVDLKVLNP